MPIVLATIEQNIHEHQHMIIYFDIGWSTSYLMTGEVDD